MSIEIYPTISNQNYRSKYDCEFIQIDWVSGSSTTMEGNIRSAQLYPGLQLLCVLGSAASTATWNTLSLTTLASNTVSTSVVFAGSGSFSAGDIVHLTYDGTYWKSDKVAVPDKQPFIVTIMPLPTGIANEANYACRCSAIEFFAALMEGRPIYPFIWEQGSTLYDSAGIIGIINHIDVEYRTAQFLFEGAGLQIAAIMNADWVATTDPEDPNIAGQFRIYILISRQYNISLQTTDWSNGEAIIYDTINPMYMPSSSNMIIDVLPADMSARQVMVDCGIRLDATSYSSGTGTFAATFKCDTTPTHTIGATLLMRSTVQ